MPPAIIAKKDGYNGLNTRHIRLWKSRYLKPYRLCASAEEIIEEILKAAVVIVIAIVFAAVSLVIKAV